MMVGNVFGGAGSETDGCFVDACSGNFDDLFGGEC